MLAPPATPSPAVDSWQSWLLLPTSPLRHATEVASAGGGTGGVGGALLEAQIVQPPETIDSSERHVTVSPGCMRVHDDGPLFAEPPKRMVPMLMLSQQ